MFYLKLYPGGAPMNSDLLAASLALTRRADFVFVSTLREVDGSPDTRIMFNLLKLRAEILAAGPAALDSPFASWLGTNTASQKVRQIRKDSRLCLYYADTTAFEGLALHGTATETLDPLIRKTIWTDAWEMYYPGGLDGGDFTLFRFHPQHGRYYHGLKVLEFDATALGAPHEQS
jgi:general stress protein 26